MTTAAGQGQTPGAKPKLSAQEVIVALRNDVKSLKLEVADIRRNEVSTNEVGEYLVKQNEVFGDSLFAVIGVLAEQARSASVSAGSDEVRELADDQLKSLLQLQSVVSPKLFESTYGVDHRTGEELAPKA